MESKHFFIAGLALLALASCGKETASEEPVFKGDKAYINVQLAYSSPQTKGTAAEPPFYYGTADENKVNGADFFFYNADGSFATHASKTLTWTVNEEDASTSRNIEKVGHGVVVLEGLKSTNYPTYMSVVLNADAATVSALQSKSISEAQAYIISAIATEGATVSSTDWTNFVMTSSTFDNGNANSGYFCEQLTPDNFQETEEAAKDDANTVTAYVERLASKVRLELGSALPAGGKIGSFEVNGTATDLFYKISGWGLNCTTGDSYTFKNIDAAWDFTAAPAFTWNDAANHRSYWGKSTVYGVTDNYYPQNYADSVSKKTLLGVTIPLNYISYNELKVEAGKDAYCRENTNTADVLKNTNFTSAVTSVLLQGQVVDADGNAVQLVNYNKTLYTFDNYKTKVLADYQNNNTGAKIYVHDGTAYNEVTADAFKEVNAYDGNIYLEFAELEAGKSYCTGDGENFNERTLDEVNALINGETTTKNSIASFYKDGLMYYNIPIEHLRNGVKYTEVGFKDKNVEANYGVVRNHFYMLTVNSIKNLGKAVYDPAEPIVPDDNDVKNYYVGAKINILSWKVVKQSVDL